ncbi:MAG: nitrogenase component 1 [Lachnospiraceae bacterium]|nr:nitrogenase component 1 [Lachnospiraceae bacterium]
MNQTARIISIYAADTSGFCSALYEYGGMVVIHDASGCNSTYTTHDEPRWYDKKCMMFISGLTEKDAVMGNDDKLIDDLVIAANKLKPEFIALCASPLPAMIGTDLDAIAYAVEQETGIPSFHVKTNGMQSYITGAGNAFVELAKKFIDDKSYRNSEAVNKTEKETTLKSENNDSNITGSSDINVINETSTISAASDKIKVNIIGVTPLDFPKKENCESLKKFIEESGFTLNACIGVDTSLSEIKILPDADVNLMVSSSGKPLCEYLYENYDIPFVKGVPYGIRFAEKIKDLLKESAKEKRNIDATSDLRKEGKVAILGESVLSSSLAAAFFIDNGINACVIETVGDGDFDILKPFDFRCEDEAYLEEILKDFDVIIGDPLFKPICHDKRFVSLPHEAFSGRCFTKNAPNFIYASLDSIEESNK